MNIHNRLHLFLMYVAVAIVFIPAANAQKEEMHTSHDHSKMVMAAQEQTLVEKQTVKVEERLGMQVAMDAVFQDETGRTLKFESLLDKPVVILPIFFNCTAVCSILQADLARALNRVDQLPGKDFNIITLSFDDDENFHHAKVSKKNYVNLITRDFPLENWFYLTGDRENILKLTDSLGYYFIKKDKHIYIHPSALMVLAKGGKIIRYLYGPEFHSFDVSMAINEAQKGEPGVSIKRGVLSFCFDYDPANKRYVFKVFHFTGTAILLLLAGFVFFLVKPSKRDKKYKDKTVS